MTNEHRHPRLIGHLAQILAAPLALALLLSVFTVGTARAWDSDCSSGEFCIYSDWWRGAGGEIAATAGSVDEYSGNYPGGQLALDNSASSAHNRKSVDVHLYQGYEYTGWSICIDSGQVDNDFGQVFNDTFSSHQVMSNDGFC